MESRLRVEKVQNGIIFTNEDFERFVDSEAKLAINQIVDRVVAALDNVGDVAILIVTPDKGNNDGQRKGY